MSRNAVEAVTAAVEPAIREAGLQLDAVRVLRAGRHSTVRVVVDLPDDARGDVTSEALGQVSLAVSKTLDATDPVPGSYVLEVSTPGVDRPLTERRHFLRARGRRLRVTTTSGQIRSEVLQGVDADDLIFASGERMPLDEVAWARQEVDLRGAAGDHDDAREEA